MISVAIGFVVVIIAAIIGTVYTSDFGCGLLSSFITFLFSIILVVIVGVYANCEIIDIQDYELYRVGDKLVYVQDNGEPTIVKGATPTEIDDNIKKPVRRIIKYDNSIFVKFDRYSIVLPGKDLTKVDV